MGICMWRIGRLRGMNDERIAYIMESDVVYQCGIGRSSG